MLGLAFAGLTVDEHGVYDTKHRDAAKDVSDEIQVTHGGTSAAKPWATLPRAFDK